MDRCKLDLRNCDCMELMAEYPDNYFELAIVDPPYGDGNHSMRNLRVGGTWATKYGKKINEWDIVPPKEYFKELFRVSKNQIIWGGNYFNMPPTRCFIIFEKPRISESFSMAMCEYAWTSFNDNAKIFKYSKANEEKYNRTHPTQKPIKLYKWLLKNYAKEGDKILDTHCGSASSVIAAIDMGFNITCSELDIDYFNESIKRIKIHLSQSDIFRKEIELKVNNDTQIY